MEQRTGIKELTEMLDGSFELTVRLIELFRDGFQTDDLLKILNTMQNDMAFMEKLRKAHEGYKAIPAELKDIDVMETSALFMLLLQYIPKMIEAIKKDDQV